MSKEGVVTGMLCNVELLIMLCHLSFVRRNNYGGRLTPYPSSKIKASVVVDRYRVNWKIHKNEKSNKRYLIRYLIPGYGYLPAGKKTGSVSHAKWKYFIIIADGVIKPNR